eukprot:TRINITY_DN8777_c0_g1::TRINITY_DN8777_c0_g1_i1::g.23870::m.23870 TRINITY_DN8777_c0_g1::TRINITY_DN8777_c0_g1_i1::g.23870  ORF type:complete len:202 (+),score=46.75,sp/Q86K94/TPPC3_DICDI/57.14/6e-72,TRAPP/PF04051.11/3.8e-39,AAA_32/PF13654.1/0.088 TRINITY_DN8777_c0_g1_i1:38-607(+)
MSAPGGRPYAKLGEQAAGKVEKINAELLTLTYGSIVNQLLQDYEDVDEVNKQLDKMGYNIGLRLIDEFLAKSNLGGKCKTFKETADVIAKVGFKMFLGITAQVTNWNSEQSEFSLILEENPLADFVELPEKFSKLWFSNIYSGVIRGALEMVQMSVECKFVRDTVRGDDATELRVIFKEYLEEVIPNDE